MESAGKEDQGSAVITQKWGSVARCDKPGCTSAAEHRVHLHIGRRAGGVFTATSVWAALVPRLTVSEVGWSLRRSICLEPLHFSRC